MASEIQWIKITTDMFEDEKVDFVSSLPEGDALIVIWLRLLTMAGKLNAGGYIFLTEKIPFTQDMLAHKFRKPLNVVRMALETFEKLGMIGFDETGKIIIMNWFKHQNVDGMERVRELTRIRTAKYRELKANNTNKDKDKELDKDLDIDIEGSVTGDATCDVTETAKKTKKEIPCAEIIDALNQITGKNFRLTDAHRKLIIARHNEGYTYNDFLTVIKKKTEQWKGTDDDQYLRPQTLFGTKFDGYLNQSSLPKKQGKGMAGLMELINGEDLQ